MRSQGRTNLVCVWVALLLAQAVAARAAPVMTDTVRLRIYWGGASAHVWTGRVFADQGRVDQLTRLAVDPLNAATLYETDGQIHLHGVRPMRHNAFDVTLTIGKAKQLTIELSPDSGPPQTFQLPVAPLLAQPFTASLIGPQNADAGRLHVHRVVDDQLRVDTGRDSLILAPGETLPLTITTALADIEPLTPIDLRVELLQGRSGPVLSTDTHRVELPAEGPAELQTRLTPPSDEGVYTVRIAAVRPPGLTKVFLPRSTGKLLVERVFQFVVFDPQRRRKLANDGQLLAVIDPTTPRWWERVPRWIWPRRLSRPEQHLGSIPPTVVGSPEQAFVELPAAKDNTPGDWHAYPLPVAGTGTPYVVEVEYPTNRPQTLTLSIFDRNTLGQTAPLGASDEVFVRNWLTTQASDTNPAPVRTARRVFWPSTNMPTLLLSNHGATNARFGRIKVYRLDEQPEPTSPSSVDKRLVAIGLTQPRLADAVGATLGLAADGSFAIDDWQTWWETATRLADLVELGGYNGAVVTVASSQGTVYPSSVLAQAPGADRQPLATSVTDLPSKDLLELLFREFDRRGLRLMPAVAFDTAIPQAELIGTARKIDQPIYDPLRKEVADAMRDALTEIGKRYVDHPSFAGVAIDLGAGGQVGYGVLPAPGGDPTTEQVDRFLASSGLAWPEQVPRNTETTSIALGGPWREQWASWRRKEMTNIYQSLAEEVRRFAPERDLVLLTHRFAELPVVDRLLTPALGSEVLLKTIYEAVGLDTATLRETDSLAIASTHTVVGGRRLSDEPTGRRVNRLRANAEELFNRQSTAVLTRTTVPRRLAAPMTNSDRLEAPLPTLSAINTPSLGVASYVDLLASSQLSSLIEGGETVSLLTDDGATTLRQRFANQPLQEATAEVIVSSDPLLVRSSSTGDHTTVELVNRLPWPINTTLTIELDTPCTGGWDDAPTEQLDPGRHVLTHTAPPHQVVSCGFDNPGVRVIGVRSTLPDDAKQTLADRLRDLQRRDLSVPSRYAAAKNLSFEELDENGRLIGWEAVVKNGASLRLTDSDPKQGEQALLVENTGRTSTVKLQTAPMLVPSTGQLAVTFHLRTNDLAPDTRVVVRIEEIGGNYTSSTTLDAKRLGRTQSGADQLQLPDVEPTPNDWQLPYAFAASDLPIGDGRPIRLVFEFVGEGAITIDALELHDLVFPLDLGAQSTRQKLALLKVLRAAESALERGDLAECYTILDGYWPRFLQAYTPLLPEPAPEVVAEQDREEAASQGEEEPPEVGGGWRSYLPRFWR